MKNAPNSRANLDKAIQRFAGNPLRENEIRNLMANAIVAQMIGEGVVKGGTGLKFRFGEATSRRPTCRFCRRSTRRWRGPTN